MLFVIHALDKPDSLELRQETRPAHLEFLADFTISVGGPIKDENGEMCGSLIILDVEDRAGAEAFVAGDPYGQAGLFQSVNIHEFMKVAWPE